MLIFWKPVIFEDRHLFTRKSIYGKGDDDPALFNESFVYTPKVEDFIINYSIGTAMIFAFCISVLLNPTVFYLKHKGEKSLIRKLFQGLAVVDFMTCICTPLVYAYFTFNETILPCSNPVLRFCRPITCTFGCCSQIITFMLAVTRFLKIRFPFMIIREEYVKRYMIAYMFLMALNNLQVPLIQSVKGIPYRNYFYVFVQYCFYVNSIHCGIGILASVVTSSILVHRAHQHSNNESEYAVIHITLHSCITILLMNIPYVFAIGLIIFVNLNPGQISFHDLLFGMMPIVTSTCNPLIIILRNKSYKKIIKNFLLKSRMPSAKIGVLSSKGDQTTDVGQKVYITQSSQL